MKKKTAVEAIKEINPNEIIKGEAKKTKKFLEDFKAFAVKGNVVDMAVGVIIGGAFGKITTSLVNDIVMPAISLITGKVNFADLALTFETAQGLEPIVIKYGMFLQNIFDFIIIAFCVFLFVKLMGKMRKKEEEKPKPVPVPTNEEILLTEIRDLLKESREK